MTHLLVDSPDGTGVSRRLRHHVSRDSPTRRRARLSPPSRGRPIRPTRVLLRVHEIRRRGPAGRTKGKVSRCIYPGHAVCEADRRTRPVPAVQRLDAITGTVRPGNDRRPMAGGAGACRLAEPRVRIPSRRRGPGLGAGHPAWPLRDPHPDESSRRRRLHSRTRYAQRCLAHGESRTGTFLRATIKARSRRI